MVAVKEFSWEEVSSPDFGARTAWREAVAAIAEKAKAKLPECNGRVDKAVAIVLNGDVELLPDGTRTGMDASFSSSALSWRVVVRVPWSTAVKVSSTWRRCDTIALLQAREKQENGRHERLSMERLTTLRAMSGQTDGCLTGCAVGCWAPSTGSVFATPVNVLLRSVGRSSPSR